MRRIGSERGAVAVLVAIVMTALLGFAAIGVDVANMASDKQQLQNGADAAAFAIAAACSKGECPESPANAATNLAVANKNDKSVNYIDVNLMTNSVTVTTGDDTEHWFAQISGPEESAIRADATVVWGPPSGVGALPLAISFCELLQQPNIDYDPATGIVTPGPAAETPTIEFYMTGSTLNGNNGCPPGELTGPSGILPGGFGHLVAKEGTFPYGCYFETVTYDNKVAAIGKDGNLPHSNCSYDDYFALIGKIALIPVFDGGIKDNGVQYYFIKGYAAFTLEEFHLNPGQFDYPDNKGCDLGSGSSSRCIKGKFVEFVFPADVGKYIGTGPNLGATVIKLID